VSADHPRVLDVDLSVLTDMPSPSWMPWEPTPCDCAEHRPGMHVNTAKCPNMKHGGLVVPQEGDRILWQVEEWRPTNMPSARDWSDVGVGSPAVAEAERMGLAERRLRTVAVSTVQAEPLPIVEFPDAPRYDHIEVSQPGAPRHAILWRWNATNAEYDDDVENLDALLDGPWGEQWTPGNVALEISTAAAPVSTEAGE
jgi:hypothetical protein